MAQIRYVYWQEDDLWYGYLEAAPGQIEQAGSPGELEALLRDVYEDLSGGVQGGVQLIGTLTAP